MPDDGLTCGFFCVVLDHADKIPFKSGTFCDNLSDGFRYDQYFFRSQKERDALTKFCGKTCGEISSEICGSDGNEGDATEAEDAFEWSPELFKSVFRDCCDGYSEQCGLCPPGDVLEFPEKQTRSNGTGFEATCAQFETWLDLEWWSHIMGETLDSYGRPSGNPTYSCSELKWSDPIWSPIREWDPTTEGACPCVDPAPSSPPTRSPSPTDAPSLRPTATAVPSASASPSANPSDAANPPNGRASPLAGDDDAEECSPKPSETFSSVGSLFVGFIVAFIYGMVFWSKSKNAGRMQWGLYEMASELVGQFIATVIGVGGIVLCIDAESSDSSGDSIMSMTSLLAVDGFELILTLVTLSIVRRNDLADESFDKERWNELHGWKMWLVRFLIWSIGSGLPLVMLFFDDLIDEPLAVMIPCFVSMGLGMFIGFFGPCVLRKPKLTAGGARLNWVLVKTLVGMIPGLIVTIYNRDWVALGWGAEAFIEVSHWIGEYI